jgi:hypothetical protein
MKPTLLGYGCLALLAVFAGGAVRALEVGSPPPLFQDTNKLVYADFENSKDNRPISNRGGLVQLFAYQERPTLPSRFKGLEGSNPPAPELVRLSKTDPNRAIAFDYELQGLNQYAGVGVQIHGQEEKDGKPAADDVSGYKYLMVQLYVTGVPSIMVEFVSHGHGIEMQSGYPQMVFKVSPGFNTYRVPLGSVSQPSWAQVKVKTKDVLKNLTAVNLVVSCNQCTPVKGTVVIDNLVFQN